MNAQCLFCSAPLEYAGVGRLPKFCTDAHRYAHRDRKRREAPRLLIEQSALVRRAALGEDVAAALEALRTEAATVLA